jgi:hypothetical protein
MNRIVCCPLAAVALLGLSLGAAAQDDETLRHECQRVAESHGVSSDQMDAWIKRCVDNASRLRSERERRQAVPEGGETAPANPHRGW